MSLLRTFLLGLFALVMPPELPPDIEMVEDLAITCEGSFLPSMYRHGYSKETNGTVQLRVFGPFIQRDTKWVHGPALVWMTYGTLPGTAPLAVFLTLPDSPVEQITFKQFQERYQDACVIYTRWKIHTKMPV